MIALWALIRKEFTVIFRDPLGVMMLFFLPAVFIIVLSVALQGAFASGADKEKVPILVAGDVAGDFAQKIDFAFRSAGIFEPRTLDKSSGGAERSGLVAAIRQGDARVGIFLPTGVSRTLDLGETGEIEILVDPALGAEFAIIVEAAVRDIASTATIAALLEKEHQMRLGHEKVLRALPRAFLSTTPEDGTSEDVDPFDEVWLTQSTNYLRDRGTMVKKTFVSGDAGEKRYPNEVQQNVPGWTVFALFWISQLLAIGFLDERKSGVYRRILLSPVSMRVYVLSKSIPYIVINWIQAVVLFVIGMTVLPLLGCHQLELRDPLAVFVTTVAISLTANGFGVLLAAISKSDTFVASVSAAALIVMSVLGGIMVPKFVMPAFMQKLSLAVPQGWAIDIYQDILVRGFGVWEILPKVGVLLLFAVGFYTVGALTLGLSKGR